MDSFTLTNWLDPRGTSAVVALVEPLPPFTDLSLTSNLVCRVLFSIISNLVCLVPLRLLYRNGEFAAVVFILNVQIKNLGTIMNSLIWRNDNIRSWWPGFGLCDVDVHIQNIGIGLFVTCLLAIVRNLARQVGLMRASALTVQERRRRNLYQALIIFPYPIVQLAMTWPVASQRYIVGTLIGCSWNPHASWPYLVFFVLPPPVFALITAGYAGEFHRTDIVLFSATSLPVPLWSNTVSSLVLQFSFSSGFEKSRKQLRRHSQAIASRNREASARDGGCTSWSSLYLSPFCLWLWH